MNKMMMNRIMMNKISLNSVLIILLAVFFVYCGTVSAEVYQYQDAEGNWIFTDTPPVYDSEKVTKMEGMLDRVDGVRDLKKELYERYHPKNDVDAAAMATVTVTSSIGIGSGFFISDNGYLLTNRHVIKGDERQAEAVDKAFEYIDEQVEIAEEDFEIRERQLAREKTILDEMKSVIEKLPSRSSQKERLKRQYQERLEYYQALKEDCERKKSNFKRDKKNYKTEKTDYANQQAVAGVSRNFKITLKNKEILYAYLVRASSSHDLALLKVDACKTPFIYPADMNRVAQRQKVWAIGSPLNIADTMKDGTVSGFTNEYIQTNAQIYPGNSGGPLVNEKGQVIGINTLKELTRNFEGMGFAIPIDTALDEFAQELK
ncbi:MAG: trypsin-like serine protease [Desulfobacteraceae bacterium]|nr:trypsin-like peptidase domain-containing protein [Desulfobacteraceae bacterium]MBC2754054.1 trypsin-like serine protease [Desulfobacteraceae bacterium]